MVYWLQFELYRSQHNNQLLVAPVGFDGVEIPIVDRREAFEAATAWLLDYVDRHQALYRPAIPADANAPGTHGGETFFACARRGLSGQPAVSASEAAAILGITRSRVGQLCSSGALESWREDAHRMVSLRSVEERLVLMGAAAPPTRPR